MRWIPFLMLCFFWCGSLVAQSLSREQKVDSLHTQLQKDSAWIFRRTFVRPYLRLENRRSFIVEEKVNFIGFQPGVVIDDRHILCAGYYFLDRRSKTEIEVLDNSVGAIRQFTKLNYFVFSYQYILFNKRYVQVNTPIEIGYGRYAGAFRDSVSPGSDFDGTFVPFGAGVQLILKPLPWVGISGSGGYRYVKQDTIKVRFNGWHYSYGVWLDARYLFREFRYFLRKRKIKQQLRELGG